MDLIVGAGKLDRTLQDVEALVDSYRTDDGLRYLDYRPLTPPDRMVPEDLAVTILINSCVAGTAFKSAGSGFESPGGPRSSGPRTYAHEPKPQWAYFASS